MSEQYKFGQRLPIPTSVGCLRYRGFTVEVAATGFLREWEGVTKWYRSVVTTTTYTGVKLNREPPQSDISYSATPTIITDSVVRGWRITTTANGDTTVDDDPQENDIEPSVWTPPLSLFPSWEPFGDPEEEDETTLVYVRSATGSWEGTETRTTVWSDEITDSQLKGALVEARDAVSLDDTFFVIAGLNSVVSVPNTSYTSDMVTGVKRLDVTDYSLGTYTGRSYISAVEVTATTNEAGTSYESRPFTVALVEVATIPDGFGQDSFRDDDKQLFSDWRRVDYLDRYPDDPVSPLFGSRLTSILALSGHNYISVSTSNIVDDNSYAGIGGVSENQEASLTVPFLWSFGPYTPPEP
jgi:hypothetical protein